MSEQKKPQAGEWWVKDATGEKVFFVGPTAGGLMAWQWEGGGVYCGNNAWHGFRHEPRCTSWDWQPEPEQKPKTEREVSLYWYDGNVVGRYADCPPTDPSFVPLIVRDGKVFIETETREVVR